MIWGLSNAAFVVLGTFLALQMQREGHSFAAFLNWVSVGINGGALVCRLAVWWVS